MRRILLTIVVILTSFSAGQAQTEAPIYLTGGHLVDVIRGEIYEDIGVLIEDDKIAGLFFDFPYNDNRIPENAVRVDLKGKYLIPGMFDLHVHANTKVRDIDVDMERFFKMFLAGGVTTIRAMSDDTESLINMKLAIDTNKMEGPNLIVGSFPPFEQAPGFPKEERTIIVNNTFEARALVREHAYLGAEWIKFYNYGDAEITEAVVDEAHLHGRKVFGHFATLGAEEASRLGVDSLEHTVGLLQSALNYEDSISLTHIGYYRLFVLWPLANQEKLDETFKTLIENGTAVVPTIAIQNIVADPKGLVQRSEHWFDLYQPEILAMGERGVPTYNFSGTEKQWKESILTQARHIARFVNMGGKVGIGSDLNPAPPLVPGLSIHQELDYYVDGGMTPLQALQAATINSAEILGWEQRFGSIEVGKQADIVALDGNPLADIKAVYAVDTVVKAGRVYKVEDLKNNIRNMISAGTSRR